MRLDLSILPVAALQAITGEELHRSTELFNVVKQLRLRLTNITEEILDRSYKQHVQNVFTQLDKKLTEIKNPSSRQAEIIMARHGLCDASMQQIILLCESISPALGGAISQLRGMHSAYFADLQELEETFSAQLIEKDRYCEEAKREVEAIDSECSQLMEASSLLDAEAVRNTTLIMGLRQELRDMNAEVARLQTMIDPNQLQSSRNATELTLSSNNSHSSPRKHMNKTSLSLSSSVSQKNNSNHLDSPKIMDTSMTRNVKGQVTFDTLKSPKQPTLTSTSQLSNSMKKIGGNNQNSFSNDTTRYMDPTMSRKAAWGAASASNISASDATALQTQSQTQQDNVVQQTKTLYGSSSAWLMDFRGELQQKMDGNIRAISLKECRALMQQFDSSKENQVSAKVLGKSTAAASQLQDIETMEIHVYRCMEKKYGLRSLAVEHAAMFVSGLKNFAKDHIDVEVFYKIFCNEIEEGFMKVQQELEKSIKDLLILQIMNQHVNKDQESLNAVVEEKLNGVVEDHEYMDIVNYLYNEKDATELRIILGVECQEAHDKKTTGQVDPRRHFEYKNDNVGTNESDLKKKLGYVPTTRGDISSNQSNYSKSGQSTASPDRRGGQVNNKSNNNKSKSKPSAQPALPSDYFDMPYKTFLRLCLQFQLRNHEKYLATFRASFLFHDGDNDGILNTTEFRNCFMGLRCGQVHVLPEDEIAALSDEEHDMFYCLLQLVDPNNTDRITFSNAADRLNSIGKRSSMSIKNKKAAVSGKTKVGRNL